TACNYLNNQKEKTQAGYFTKEIIANEANAYRINEYKAFVDTLKARLASVRREVDGSAEGGVIESFFNQDDTIKKEIEYYGETGKRVVHIYLIIGHPVLVLDTEIRYKEAISSGNEISIQ